MALTVRVIAPDKTVWDAEAEEVILPSTTGQLGILSGHAPLLSALDTGVMRVRAGKDWNSIAVMGGFAEVDVNEVTVLVNGAEKGSDIDAAEAKSAYTAAETALNNVSDSDTQEKMQATTAFKKARARLQASGGKI